MDDSSKVVIVFGARQVGKTTLIKSIIEGDKSALLVNADQLRYQDVFSSRDLEKMQEVIGDHQLIFIDDAQNIPSIGQSLKLLHDELPKLKIIASSSSSFKLANRLSEPLTGKSIKLELMPISIEELLLSQSKFDIRHSLPRFLRYGMYLEILTTKNPERRKESLRALANDYLFRDILQLTNIRYPLSLRSWLIRLGHWYLSMS